MQKSTRPHSTAHSLRKGAVIHLHGQINIAVSSAVGNFYTAIVPIALIPGGSCAIPTISLAS